MDEKFTIEVIDNTIEGILILEDGFIKDLNQTALEILKYDLKNELIGNLATGVLVPSTSEKRVKFNKQIFDEISIYTKNGNIIPSLVKIVDIKNSNKKIVYLMDLSELKDKEKLLLQQSKLSAMGEMLSMIAHQWRQPLNYVSTIIARLKFNFAMGKIEENFTKEKIEEISKQINYMSNTIDDFKNFFSKEEKKENLYLIDIVKSAVEIIDKSFSNLNIDIKINNSALMPSSFFKNDLIQVLLNILNNSKEAFIENNIKDCEIILDFFEDEDYQYINIKDNAGGIKKEIIDEIFKPYFSTKKSKNGSGLGLYMSKMIIEKKFDGDIIVKSENDCTFFILKLKKLFNITNIYEN